MTDIQIEKFWVEVNLIQQRHHLFFPDEQKQFIRLDPNGNGHSLMFLGGYRLPECITLEIQLCFKMILSFVAHN